MRNGGVFHLYGHSWEIEKTNSWKRLERVLQYLNENTNSTQRFTNGGLALKTENAKQKYYCEFDALQFDTEYRTLYYFKEIEIIGNMVKRFDKSQAKILDIGCGSGRLSSLFNKAKYFGIDYCDNLIKYAKKEYGAPNRKFVCGDYWKSNKGKSGKYDLILLWGFIEDEIDPFRIITSLSHMVKKGTRIIFTLQNCQSIFFRTIKYIRNEYFDQPYSLTSFDKEVLAPYVEKYCRKNNYHYQITSLGLINPAHKSIPFIAAGLRGNTLVYIFDKV
jgi:SAM-dependent methyltransferase